MKDQLKIKKKIFLQSKVDFPCPSLCIIHVHWWQVHECMALVRQTAQKKVKTYNRNLGRVFLQVDDGRALTWMKKSKGKVIFLQWKTKQVVSSLALHANHNGREFARQKKNEFLKVKTIKIFFLRKAILKTVKSFAKSTRPKKKLPKTISSKIRWQVEGAKVRKVHCWTWVLYMPAPLYCMVCSTAWIRHQWVFVNRLSFSTVEWG